MISFISLNIERNKHLDVVLPFLKERGAEVVCLQEVFEREIPRIEEAVGGQCFFAPMTRFDTGAGIEVEGIAMCSRLPVFDQRADRYAGAEEGSLATFDSTTAASKFATERFILMRAFVEKEGERYHIATTHFTWSPNGQPSDLQRSALSALLPLLDAQKELVFCGDLNAPRGGEIFTAFAERFTDNIPPHYRTSLDPHLHSAGALERMVDGLFTTPGYRAFNVELISGLSDHKAIVADIERTPV